MALGRYYAAAAAGIPNMASKNPAMRGQAAALGKLGDPVHATSSGLGRGSMAGYKNAPQAVVEVDNGGYGGFQRRKATSVARVATQRRPNTGEMKGNRINDARSYRRPQLDADRKLAALV